MKTIKGLIVLLMMYLCSVNVCAQGVMIYKTDGKTIRVLQSELDSIVSLNNEETNKVYKSDGTAIKVLYAETDSIVAFGGLETSNVFVDLGLSVMWASRNVGAEKAVDYGDFFAWGEINTKSSYTKENSLTYGREMTSIAGHPEYDISNITWGGSARIPTQEEFNELRDKCTWEWTTINNVNGQLVTGPSGSSIFLPAAGVKTDTTLNSQGVSGSYWSSTPYENDDKSAYVSIFNSSGYWGSWRSRSDGLPIRAVSGNIQSISYTGDTVKVEETSADIAVLFSYIPSEGISGGLEYWTKPSEKHRKDIYIKKDGEYVISLTGLEKGTKYKYRAYVKVNDKYIYGFTEEFVTKNSEDNLTQGEWIDLGLSVKWASHNVGAQLPEDMGNYFAWGEIYQKSSYEDGECITMDKDIDDISGKSDYDAATAIWGGSSRMPTRTEIEELRDKCTWQRTHRNGVDGMLVTGPNGNSIFLPSAGIFVKKQLNYLDLNGFYWSSTPYENDNTSSYGLSFSKEGARVVRSPRADGRTIRPVSE